MKRFLISLSVLFSFYAGANACGYEEESDRYYMFSYCDNSFRDKYESAMDEFWKVYCNKDYRPWHEELVKAANAKNDVAMKLYLRELGKYDEISQQVQNTWEYPTALELSKRKETLRSIVNVAKANLNGKYGSHWALLVMRANMLLNNHQDNIQFFTTKAKAYPNDCYKDMMRNIYARDLLLTGKKQQAWNIYAEQNDQQSLLWSVRKYTNLAGIKTLCAENPNAPVLNFLVQTYVNRIQSLVNESENVFPYLDYSNIIWGKAYAQVSSNQMQEFKDFIAFSKQMAQSGKSKVPCMWMSAASLVNYFIHDNKQAKSCIDMAMNMEGTEAMKDNARRIRMLVEPTVVNVKSNEFKSFIAKELRWLDSKADKAVDSDEWNARERIIKHSIAAEYDRCNEQSYVMALHAISDFNSSDRWAENKTADDCFDYSSYSFCMIDKLTAKEIEQHFKAIDDNTKDPLSQYLSEKLSARYSENYRNDLIGTKLIAENKLAEAIPYLQKVQQKYLNSQAIGYYVYHRDYKTPFWNGFQSIDAPLYDDNGNLINYKLNGNVKVNFCKDILALKNKYGAANLETRKQIAYELATYYFQASYKGQCWFITHYGQSVGDEQNPKEANFPEIARQYLKDAVTSSDNALKTAAMFAQVSTSGDSWYSYEYDSNYNQVFKINYGSEQYSKLKALNNYVRTTGFEPEYISNCDVIAQFRKKGY